MSGHPVRNPCATSSLRPPPACPADATGDGIVDVIDFLLVLAAWDTADLATDVNDDGIVDVIDFLLLLAAWGPCRY